MESNKKELSPSVIDYLTKFFEMKKAVHQLSIMYDPLSKDEKVGISPPNFPASLPGCSKRD